MMKVNGSMELTWRLVDEDGEQLDIRHRGGSKKERTVILEISVDDGVHAFRTKKLNLVLDVGHCQMLQGELGRCLGTLHVGAFTEE